ncbi:SPOR domain-containing protein [Bdellovibrio bacteriovorus]|nr:SPOR domain-containing protein [Bdellovibrio bacteriovorus]
MSSQTDAFLKLGLFFFIALLSFSIGTFVGKKFSDNQHQLAALEPQKNSHGEGHGDAHAERGVASTSPSEHRSGAMTDEEIAKLAEEFVADDTVPATTTAGHDAHGAAKDAHGAPAAATDAHGTPAAEAHGAVKAEPAKDAHGGGHAEATAPSHASEAAKNVAQGKAPTAPETQAPAKKVIKEERLPSSLPKDVAQYAVGKFTVQVAAYPQEAEAQKMASDLKTKGYSAFYIPANVKGTTYYRVSVGQFATQKEATSYRAEFLAKSKMGSAIVQKISE